MDELPPVNAPPPRSFPANLLPILVLLLLAGALRTWLLCHTEVASRDSIGFIRIAWKLGCEPWWKVLPEVERHPGYPALVLLASYPVRWFYHSPDPLMMQLSAQLVSVIAGTLLVIPMFLLGKELFDRRVAFWAALLFQCLPTTGPILSDGISEATFLLIITTGWYTSLRGMRSGAAGWFLATGALAGFAYLVRPEGVLLLGATGFVLLAVQGVKSWRRPWFRVGACGTALVLSALAVGLPYAYTIGGLSVKPSWHHVAQEESPQTTTAPQPSVARAGLLGVWWPGHDGTSKSFDAHGWALGAMGYELLKGSFYVLWLPALLGLWRHRSRLWSSPDHWIVQCTCGGLLLVLWHVAAVNGYVSGRHAILVLLYGSYLAVAGVPVLAGWSARILDRLRPRSAEVLQRRTAVLTTVTLAGLVLAGLPESLSPLHAERSGFREVGFWLAEHVPDEDFILDPYSWSKYYSGRTLVDLTLNPQPPQRLCVWYIVLEESKNAHPRLGWHKIAVRLAESARVVHRQEVRRGKKKAEITVYAIPVPPRKQPNLDRMRGEGP